MTVSRKIEASFDAPDDETADWLADLLRRVVMGENFPNWGDLDMIEAAEISAQAFSAEPVIPSPEPLVESERNVRRERVEPAQSGLYTLNLECCGEAFTLHDNGGELDQHECRVCGTTYTTECVAVDLVVESP